MEDHLISLTTDWFHSEPTDMTQDHLNWPRAIWFDSWHLIWPQEYLIWLIWFRTASFDSRHSDWSQHHLIQLRTTWFESWLPNFIQDHLNRHEDYLIWQIWSRTTWCDSGPPNLIKDHLIWPRTDWFDLGQPDLTQNEIYPYSFPVITMTCIPINLCKSPKLLRDINHCPLQFL